MSKIKKKDIKFIVTIIISILGMLMLSYYQFEVQSETRSSKLFIIMSIILSVFTIGYSLFIYKNKKINAEKLFLYIVPIMTILFFIFMPIGRGHDEWRHWYRAYEISEGHLLTEKQEDKVIANLPKSVVDGVNTDWGKIKYKDVVKHFDTSINEERISTNMANVAVYSPVQYIPQTIGILISRLFSDKMVVIAYSARLVNMIVTLALLYLAIKIIPFGKKIILIISMLPISIEAFASMSPDALTISISLLFVAYILRIVFDKDYKIRNKDQIILTVLSIFIALCKIVYIPLVGLVLIIPKERYKNKKSKIIFTILLLLVSIISSLVWFGIANSFLATSSNGASSEKIKIVLTSPIDYCKKLIYTMNIYGEGYLSTLFGTNITMREKVNLYTIVPLIYFLLFMTESCTDEKIKNRFYKFQIIIIGFIVLAVVGLIFTSLYVQWTDIKEVVIKGVQGRYFIPIMLLIGFLLSKINIVNNYSEENRIKTIGIVGLVLQVYIILAMIIVCL